MIAGLLSTSPNARRHAFDSLTPDRDTAYAAREILAFDEDAQVRARAALFLARAPAKIATPALNDALEDPMPLVRHAAVRALATCGEERSIERASRVAVEDPIWWVRRAAVVTCAILGKTRAIPTLREALEDPFWRVRSASVRALLVMGERDVLEKVGPATTARSAGALCYLARRLGQGARLDHAAALDVPNAIVARLDPDPAVVTARVERGDAVTTAFLVECLGDPHEALRVTARKRLARSRDRRAFELAMLWLDEPRIPHAAQTVITLLDALDPEDASAMLDVAFARGGFGALCWAASYVGLSRDESRLEALLTCASHEHPMVRCAVIEALAALGEGEDAVAAALNDRDPRVARTAVQALWNDPRAARAETRGVAVRRVLVAGAAEREDVSALRAASRDDDPRVRAIALEARASLGDLDAAERAACLADEDPWVRAPAIDATWAERALANDAHPWVRRAAFRVLVALDTRRAGELAAECDDPYLQTRAAALLDPHEPAHLTAVLRLARGSSRGVRAAAADALERTDVDDDLDRLLRSPAIAGDDNASVRIAALAFRSRRFEDADLERIKAAREGESPEVRAWIDDVLDVAPARPSKSGAASETAPLRPLGKSGLQVPALVVSGAGMLPPRAYVDAMRAGCNMFFWEPRYHGLGRMLARHRDARVVAGTYHATERAIVSDVERSLRRLRRDVLDVFLLFWVRSHDRVSAESFEVLSRLKQQGKIRAFGFSTHDRDIACDAITAREWDVVMTRHSLVHPGAESRFFPLARDKNVGVLGFSALSYSRALAPTVTAPDAYRYSLSQSGVSACLSAPRNARDLTENLSVLRASPLSAERQRELRDHGALVHQESADFARSIRRHPIGLSDANAFELEKWLHHEDSLDPQFG